MRKVPRLLAVPLLGLAAAWLARAAGSPPAGIETSPPNPAAGQRVLLRALSPAPDPGAWWDFGDGESSRAPAPAHAWEAPGEYTIRLSTADGVLESPILVSPADTLRLLPAHPFEITLEARHPATGARMAARARGEGERYGWFRFDELAGDAVDEGPDVVVKVVEAARDGHYWILWSGMTSLDYTVTIREVATGRIAVHRADREATGGADLES